MANRTDISHIWLGLFGEEAPRDFFVESYEREDDEPLSKFAASQGEVWYDHDFVEISYLKESRVIRELVKGHSYWEQYIEPVVQRAAELEILTANVFVMASKKEIEVARSVEGPGFKLWYVGTYECRI